MQHPINLQTVEALSRRLHRIVEADDFVPDLLVGLSRGGLVPLAYLAGEACFNVQHILTLALCSYEGTQQGALTLLMPITAKNIAQFTNILIIDDLAETGATLIAAKQILQEQNTQATIKTAALYAKPMHAHLLPDYYVKNTNDWIVFPWEKQANAH